ncbi:MAG: NRDE family protein [Roseibacillus sp.]|jgi:hypothetical protein|nr:hypothetical protein [Roseibacillus sp.]MDP7106252.1 NRDE family protein [Roseibacillus sp.]MDP7308872.1 NRDE family protein [Roseibacillus sp.]MDP7655726.1 NRDE family protein [Roseibacillus sp.]HJM64985.1 NRDE family protein [Roseibacillus sp.]|tara:strand:+ start:11228 stop:11974 length:747 start_codon:yes stop_codon:yes gene_type:complete
MCTLTWWRESAGSYEVYFNRDERKTRAMAEPPRLREREGVSFLAPIDPDGGGTWMLANERGLLVCLLNRWHEQAEGMMPSRSRGQVVMEMAALENVPAVEERLRLEDLEGVLPFKIVGFDPVGERAWTWNGSELAAERNPELPLYSSSFHYAEVRIARLRRFQELCCSQRMGSNLLGLYHSDTEDNPSPFTPRMLRSDAQTMSRSSVSVRNGNVTWTYLEERPELAGEPRRLEASLRSGEPAERPPGQ